VVNVIRLKKAGITVEFETGSVCEFLITTKEEEMVIEVFGSDGSKGHEIDIDELEEMQSVFYAIYRSLKSIKETLKDRD